MILISPLAQRLQSLFAIYRLSVSMSPPWEIIGVNAVLEDLSEGKVRQRRSLLSFFFLNLKWNQIISIFNSIPPCPPQIKSIELNLFSMPMPHCPPQRPRCPLQWDESSWPSQGSSSSTLQVREVLTCDQLYSSPCRKNCNSHLPGSVHWCCVEELSKNVLEMFGHPVLLLLVAVVFYR